MVRVFANGLGDLGSIPGRVIRKTQKMVLDLSLLNTQNHKVQIKGKEERSKERSSTLFYTLVQNQSKREPSGHPRLRSPTLLMIFTLLSTLSSNFIDTVLSLTTYIYIYIYIYLYIKQRKFHYTIVIRYIRPRVRCSLKFTGVFLLSVQVNGKKKKKSYLDFPITLSYRHKIQINGT